MIEISVLGFLFTCVMTALFGSGATMVIIGWKMIDSIRYEEGLKAQREANERKLLETITTNATMPLFNPAQCTELDANPSSSERALARMGARVNDAPHVAHIAPRSPAPHHLPATVTIQKIEAGETVTGEAITAAPGSSEPTQEMSSQALVATKVTSRISSPEVDAPTYIPTPTMGKRRAPEPSPLAAVHMSLVPGSSGYAVRTVDPVTHTDLMLLRDIQTYKGDPS